VVPDAHVTTAAGPSAGRAATRARIGAGAVAGREPSTVGRDPALRSSRPALNRAAPRPPAERGQGAVACSV
jgi:hypothetical protein